jgi:hypothetical protein
LDYQSADEGGYNSAPKQIRNSVGVRINARKGKKVNSSIIGAPEVKGKKRLTN